MLILDLVLLYFMLLGDPVVVKLGFM
jgi:hypothetical protein